MDRFGEELASVVLEDERTFVVPCSSLFFPEGSVLEVRWTCRPCRNSLYEVYLWILVLPPVCCDSLTFRCLIPLLS